uniref:Uncharacterized protein n=1 Tax=Arundo donax TaxID=35708 RepID=A0A0A8XTA1_ARUDO
MAAKHALDLVSNIPIIVFFQFMGRVVKNILFTFLFQKSTDELPAISEYGHKIPIVVQP